MTDKFHTPAVGSLVASILGAITDEHVLIVIGSILAIIFYVVLIRAKMRDNRRSDDKHRLEMSKLTRQKIYYDRLLEEQARRRKDA